MRPQPSVNAYFTQDQFMWTKVIMPWKATTALDHRVRDKPRIAGPVEVRPTNIAGNNDGNPSDVLNVCPYYIISSINF
jgi:hypothetical protein